jgi:hypothetical protein
VNYAERCFLLYIRILSCSEGLFALKIIVTFSTQSFLGLLSQDLLLVLRLVGVSSAEVIESQSWALADFGDGLGLR